MSAGRGEGRSWLETALEAADAEAEATAHDALDPPLRIKTLTALCYLAAQGFDLASGIAAGEQAVALAEAHGDTWTTAWAKQSLALTLQLAGEHRRAAGLLDEARVVMEAAGDHWRVAGTDLVRCVRGVLEGDLAAVDRASREVLHRAAVAGYEPFVAWGHLVRAHVEETEGDLAGALLSYERALALTRPLELDHDIAFALAQTGRVALLAGDAERAAATLDEALAVAEAAEADWFVALVRVHQATLARQRGDEPAAAELLRQVAEWAGSADPASGPAAFFLVLGGDPRTL
jgi:tetratricopeptide (TPR) repeat protein